MNKNEPSGVPSSNDVESGEILLSLELDSGQSGLGEALTETRHQLGYRLDLLESAICKSEN